MATDTPLTCACGHTRMDVTGDPIASVECCCTSCRNAGARMQQLAGAPCFLTDYGATPFVMYRKDRVRIVAGQDTLKSYRLTPEASTRRVIASCCNTPLFLEFEKGHWLSLYAEIWAEGAAPPPTMRTMTGDLPDGTQPPADIPNPRTHNIGFYVKLLGAWVAMGFRVPQMPALEEIEL